MSKIHHKETSSSTDGSGISSPSFSLLPRQIALLQPPPSSSSSSSPDSSTSFKSPTSVSMMRKRRAYSLNGPLNNQASPLMASLGDLTIQSPKKAIQPRAISSSRSPFSHYCGGQDNSKSCTTSTHYSEASKQVPLTVLSAGPSNSTMSPRSSTPPTSNFTPQKQNNSMTTIASPTPIRPPKFTSSSPLLYSASTPTRTPNNNNYNNNDSFLLTSPNMNQTPSSANRRPLLPMIQHHNCSTTPTTPKTPLPKMMLSPRKSPSVYLPPDSPAADYIPDTGNHKTHSFASPSATSRTRLQPMFSSSSNQNHDFMGKQMDGLLRGFGNHKPSPPKPSSKKLPEKKLERSDSLALSDNDSCGGDNVMMKEPPIVTLSLELPSASTTGTKKVTPYSSDVEKSLLQPTTESILDIFSHNKKNHGCSYDSDQSISDIEDNDDNFFLSSPSTVVEEKNEAADNAIPSSSSHQRQGRVTKHRKVDHTGTSAVDSTKKFESNQSAASLYGMDIIQEHSISNVSLVEMNLPPKRRSFCSKKNLMLRSDSTDSILSGCGLNIEDTPLYSEGRDLVTPPLSKPSRIMLSPPPIRETNLTSYFRNNNCHGSNDKVLS